MTETLPGRHGTAGFVLAGLLTIVAVFILISLGMWQLRRLEWKENLIAAVETRSVAPPVAPPGPSAWPDFAIDEWQYRAVELDGRFGERELDVYMPLTQPRGPLGGIGYFVVTPFTTTDGWTVLVNRGFVPEANKDPSTRPASRPGPEPVRLTGLVRESEQPNFVTPDPDLDKNIWFARDRDAMVAALGLPTATVAPYMIDADAAMTPPGGLPQAGETRMSFPNSHLQYALTWFGLAAVFGGGYLIAAWRRLTRR